MKPKIRLKGFNDEWATRSLGSFGSVAMCKRIFKEQTSNNGDVPFYKIGTFGSTADAYISKGLYHEYKSKFSFPEKGDILISAAGTIGRIVEYKGEDAYFQDSNIVWLKHNEEIDNSFLKQLYSIIKWKGLEGATIKRLYNNIILETEVDIPRLNEQKAIANYFSSIDLLIQSTSKKIESLKQVKAASMQSMFPQEGETAPRVRFKGFKGDWQTLSIADICEKKSSALSESLLGPDCGKYPVYGAKGYIQNIEYYQFEMPYISLVKDGAGVGRSQLCPAYSSIIGTMQCIIAKENVDVTFLAYLFETLDFSSYIIGSTIPHIYFRDYCSELVKFPSIYEQKKIADYFANLDSQISLQSQRLEKLKQIKAACLDNMFV